MNGLEFSLVKGPDGKAAMFTGNVDQNSVVKNMFMSPIYARYIRIVPIESSASGPGLRFNLLGCSPESSHTTSTGTPQVPTATPRPVSTIEPSKRVKKYGGKEIHVFYLNDLTKFFGMFGCINFVICNAQVVMLNFLI
jgi:hypothetical protein